MLHQCGLRPPADEAALPVFDEILVDIGDEQSIEMSLSTFSAHVHNLSASSRRPRSDSLVLLDEIAAGTDPVEGAALAEALLGRLATQARLTVTTSHYAELKEWASAADGASNAATAIDPDSGEPLYTVTLGRPGTSHALRTAERLGLSADVVAAARSTIAPERLRVAELVAEAEAAARDAQAALAAAAAEQREAEAARLTAQRAAEGLQDEIEQVRSSAAAERQRALAQAEAELAGVRAELEELRAEIRAARKLERERGRAATPVAQKKEAERDRRLGEASRPRRPRLPLARPARRAVAADRAARGRRPGRRCVDRSPGHDHRDRRRRGDGARERRPPGARPRRSPAARSRRRPTGRARPRPAVTVRAMIQPDLSDEIDLRGRTAQEAREAVRDLVDAARSRACPRCA